MFALTLLAAGACDSDAECERNDQCEAGFACLKGHCMRPCVWQSSCAGGEVCYEGYCRQPVPGASPVLESVYGNASNNASVLGDGVVVTGSGLATATFELQGEEASTPLVVKTQSETQAEVLVPQSVRAGEYAFVATNASGRAEAALTLILPTYTSDELIDQINAAPTRTLAPSVLPAAVLGRLAELEAKLASLDACPAGYTRDASATAIVLCKRGADEMVKVGDFWVDRYEGLIVDASFYNGGRCDGTCVEGTTCFGSAGGDAPADNYPQTFPDTGNVRSQADKLYACSVKGVVPSRRMTWFQAQQACVAAGKHLITNEEWQAAAAGTFDPGSWDGSAGSTKCNTNAITNPGPRATGLAGGTPAGNDSCVSLHGVEDMVGNLQEWTTMWSQAGLDVNGMVDGWGTAEAWPSDYSRDATWNVNGRAWDGAAWRDGLPAAMLRGGGWSYGTDAGVFTVFLNDAPSSRGINTGFRCARSR